MTASQARRRNSSNAHAPLRSVWRPRNSQGFALNRRLFPRSVPLPESAHIAVLNEALAMPAEVVDKLFERGLEHRVVGDHGLGTVFEDHGIVGRVGAATAVTAADIHGVAREGDSAHAFEADVGAQVRVGDRPPVGRAAAVEQVAGQGDDLAR